MEEKQLFAENCPDIVVNLSYNGESDLAKFSNIPRIGEEIIHPKWGGVRVKDVTYNIAYEGETSSIQLTLE